MSEEIKLSICIATYNRGKFIADTLDSILCQMESGVELIVLDGASPDNTSEVMAQFRVSHPNIQYYRENKNSGIDADYDKAVAYARGEFCWLMTDDDLLCTGAIRRVMVAIEDYVDLLVVNARVKNSNFSKTLDDKLCKLPYDKKFEIEDNELFFHEVGHALSFIGCVIIRRDLWLSRDRASYYGTLFVHVGVIFQSPPIQNVRFIVEPSIDIRYGNAMWTPRGFEIWMFKWPKLIWSFNKYSNSAKALICPREPWRNLKMLVLYRAIGGYGVTEFSNYLADKANVLTRTLYFLVAVFPGSLMNSAISIYCLIAKPTNANMSVYSLTKSCYSNWVTRFVASLFDVSDKK
jgi:abequosyltransferase